MKNTFNRKGFTLAELLIVVAIIGVLVSISIPMFSGQLEKARQATDLSNMRSATAAAVSEYLMEGKSGPVSYAYNVKTGYVQKSAPEGYGKSKSLEYEGTTYNPLGKFVTVTVSEDAVLAAWSDSFTPVAETPVAGGGTGGLPSLPEIPGGDSGDSSGTDNSAQLKSLQNQLDTANNHIASLSQQLVDALNASTEKDGEITKLTSDLAAANANIQNLTSQINALTASNTELTTRNQELEAENVRLQAQLDALTGQPNTDNTPADTTKGKSLLISEYAPDTDRIIPQNVDELERQGRFPLHFKPGEVYYDDAPDKNVYVIRNELNITNKNEFRPFETLVNETNVVNVSDNPIRTPSDVDSNGNIVVNCDKGDIYRDENGNLFVFWNDWTHNPKKPTPDNHSDWVLIDESA